MHGIHVQMHADIGKKKRKEKRDNVGRGLGAIRLMHVPAQVLIVSDRVLVIHTREMQSGNKINFKNNFILNQT